MKYHYYMTRFDFAPDVMADLEEMVNDLNRFQDTPPYDVIDGINCIHVGGNQGTRIFATVYTYGDDELLQRIGGLLFKLTATQFDIVYAVKQAYPEAREIVIAVK